MLLDRGDLGVANQRQILCFLSDPRTVILPGLSNDKTLPHPKKKILENYI